MSGSSQQKLKLLYLMRILREKSDEEHPLSAVDIIAELDRYGIAAERKSIYSDIQLLESFEMDIVQTRTPKQGWFLASRDFETPEMRLLIDAVQSAAFITPKKTKELLQKLERQLSQYQARDIKRQVYIDSRIKCANEEIYYIIDVIHRAIGLNRQVSFLYYRREVGRGRTTRNQGKPFVVSPYAMVWVNDHYYLVGNLSKYNSLTHFRLDRMGTVVLTEYVRRSFEEVSDYRNDFDAADYAFKSFGMFGGETKNVSLRCTNKVLEEIADRFGDELTIIKDGESHFRAGIVAHVSLGFVSWVMQFGADVEVLAPKDMRAMVQSRAEELCALYRDPLNGTQESEL